MITIPIRVCGDIWVNPTEVQQQLYNTNLTVPIQLDFQAEGPSITAMGIVDLLDQYCSTTGRSKNTITIINNSNNVELTTYFNKTPGRSHFFNMGSNYWCDVPLLDSAYKRFGFFTGRRTMSRAKILYDLWHEFNDQCLLSSLKNTEVDPWIIPSQGINLERLEDWVSDQELFKKWFASCPVKSVDDHSIRDQYVTNPQTNSDILNFYNQFAVELVSETYTLGDTFFPTEKTVRPLMAAKPIIVYGPKNYLKRLKDLGFDTYHQCWNESYDQLEGPERWAAIKQLLPTVTLSDVAMDIALHNRQHLANLIKE